MDLKMNPRYKELLSKYYSNNELRELFDLARLDIHRREMIHYQKHGSYPVKADTIDLIMLDMLTMESYYKGNK